MGQSVERRFNTLVEVFESSVDEFTWRPLFGTKEHGVWNWMTYRDFGAKVDAACSGLAALGVDEGDRVAVISNNRPEWAIMAYATYCRGAAYVPMYESQLPEDWHYILADCGAKVVCVATTEIQAAVQSFADELPALEHVVCFEDAGELPLDELLELGRKSPVERAHPEPGDIAGLIYTSGTTGKPKGVMLSHSNLANNVSAMIEVFPMSPDDRSLSFLPWAHSFGQTVELHGLFAMGASMGIAESIPKIIENLSEVRPTLLFSVPRIFNKIHSRVLQKVEAGNVVAKKLFEAALATAQKKKALGSRRRVSGLLDFQHRVLDRFVLKQIRDRFGGRLRYAFSGGAAISKEVAEFIDALGVTVYEGYGLTETSPVATCNRPAARKIGSVGKALPGVEVRIDTSMTEDDTQGEIIIKGHNVMMGYYNLPEEDAKVFTEDGAFRTGDMGYLDDKGFLFITGRIKEQYKLENGKYVVPAPLEEQLKLSPYIANAFVYGMNRRYNVALIVPDPETVLPWAKEQGLPADMTKLVGHDALKSLIEKALAERGEHFKHYERVKSFELLAEDFTVDNGMLTPKMSLKRRKVMERYGENIEALYR